MSVPDFRLLHDASAPTDTKADVGYRFVQQSEQRQGWNYLKAFGSISVLFIEVKYKIGRGAERLNEIAQVIAECDGESSFFFPMSYINANVLSVLVFKLNHWICQCARQNPSRRIGTM